MIHGCERCSEDFCEGVLETIEVLFPHSSENFSFINQVKDRLYNMLVNDYAEDCYYFGVETTILKLLKKL